jgi:flavin-dependent dehydrogenase
VKDAVCLPLTPTRLGGNGVYGVVSVVVTRLSVKQKTRVRFPTSPQELNNSINGDIMNIVVVGGGTAGWITAALITKKFPTHNITVLESSKIGIIGVGESTTGYFTEMLLNDLGEEFGIDHDEFIIETGASLKFGIKHKGWTPRIDEHYFGVLEGSPTRYDPKDLVFAYSFLAAHGKEHTITHTGQIIEQNKSNLGPSMRFEKFGHAFHIDGVKSGKYFSKKCLTKPNVKHVDSEILNVLLDERGFVSKLQLSNGEFLEGDFFIDCTGFARVLINKLDDSWISYKKYLPVDTGMPFLENYLDGEYPTPYTTAWAQKNGWLWQTPLLSRRGNGYAFDSNFINREEAQKEIEQVLGRDIEPIKFLKFDAGRKSRAWVKNCLAIGLSYGFLEPLEGTGIHANITQAKSFIDEYLCDTIENTVNEGSINLYNKRIGQLYDDTKDFINLHYMGGRQDSEFWRYVSSGATQTDFVRDILETAKSRMPSWNDFIRCHRGVGWELYCYVMAGIGRLNAEETRKMFTRETWMNSELQFNHLRASLEQEYTYYQPFSVFVDYYRSLRQS